MPPRAHKYLTLQTDDRTGALSAGCDCGWTPTPVNGFLLGTVAEGYDFVRQWVAHRTTAEPHPVGDPTEAGCDEDEAVEPEKPLRIKLNRRRASGDPE